MPTALMNEAERFLLQNWSEAHRMEKTMEGVRSKYKELFDRVVEAVTESHPDLDQNRYYVTQFWGDGSVGFSRITWPGNDMHPAGLWIWNLRLEVLADDTQEAPRPSIWIGPKVAKSVGVDVEEARSRLLTAAVNLLAPDERDQVTDENLGESLLAFKGPSKRELLEALVQGDGDDFVRRLVEQVDLMSRFVPVLDEVFTR